MKNFTNKYHSNYFIGFAVMCLIAVYLGVTAILLPRPHTVLFAVSAAIIAAKLYKCSVKGARFTIYEYNEILKDYRARKKAAEAAGEEFTEKFPIKPPKTAGNVFTYFGAFFCSFIAIVWLSLPLAVLFPYQPLYVYKNPKMHYGSHAEVQFYPQEIPKGAKNVRWIVVPSFLQATGWELLEFEADREYIENIVSQYGGKAVDIRPRDPNTLAFLSKNWSKDVKNYVIYDYDDWNHPWEEGFLVDTENNKIVFYKAPWM